MPTALAEKFLGGNDHQSKNEIPEQEDERQIVSTTARIRKMGRA
jgi:hypothetical protein